MKKRLTKKRSLFIITIFAVTILTCLSLYGINSFFSADVVTPNLLPPSNLTALDNADGNQISLQWKDNSNNESGFKIERSDDIVAYNFAEISRASANQTKFTDTDIVPGKRYWYRISAFDSKEISDYSSVGTPTRYENKNFLKDIGGFEEESNFSGIAKTWVKNTWTEFPSADFWEYRLDADSVTGTKSQYLGFRGPTEQGSKQVGIYASKDLVINDNSEIGIHHGDKVFLNLKNYYMTGNAVDSDARFSLQLDLARIDETRAPSQTYELTKTDKDHPLSYSSSNQGGYVVAPDISRLIVTVNILKYDPMQEGETAGINIDDIELVTQRTVRVPAERNRNISTQRVCFVAGRDDIYDTAKNYDTVSGGVDSFAQMSEIRYYNPNIKLIGYTSSDFADVRGMDFKDPPISYTPVPFAWALDQQKKLPQDDQWFYEYPPHVAQLESYGDIRETLSNGSIRKFNNDGATPLNYVFFSDYQDRYPANLNSMSYREAWLSYVIDIYSKNKFNGMFLDDTIPFIVQGTKTDPTTGEKSTVDVVEFKAAEIQDFMHYIVPRLHAALNDNFEIIQNSASQHYDDKSPGYYGWQGKTYLNPTWDPANETPGVQGAPSDYDASKYSKNSYENTTDTFFQEYAYLNKNWITDDLNNQYYLHSWTESIKDLDLVKVFNQSITDERLKKHTRQSLEIVDRPDKGNYINNPVPSEDLTDLSRYDTGWAPFVLSSYLLSNNQFTSLGIMSGTGAEAIYKSPHMVDPGWGLTVKLGNAIEDRKIIYNEEEYNWNDSSVYNDDLKQVLQYRKFQNGLVVVNGSPDQNENYTIPNNMIDDLGREYPKDTVITLLPHTGRIFFNLPAVEAKVSNNPDQRQGFFVESPAVALQAIDLPNNSFDSARFSLDGGAEQNYSGEISIPEGDHTLSYYGIKDGVSGQLNQATYRVRTTRPEKPNVTHVRAFTYRSQVNLKGSSGPEVGKIKINNDSFFFSTGSSWSSQLDLNLGENEFEIKAEDGAGNESDTNTIAITRRKEGDENVDGRVDIRDFSVMLANWNKQEDENGADFNEDGKVDIRDFAILLANWQK